MIRKYRDLSLALTILTILSMVQIVNAATPIDIHKSKIEWLGTKVTGQHNGTLKLKKADVTIERGKLSSGQFIFDMTSIQVVDIKDPKRNKSLERHLKNDDFFGVNQYPTAVFEFSQATPIKGASSGEPNYYFKGDLTMKGITHALEFDALVKLKKSKGRASGKILVDRTKYDIRYKSGKFFDGLGDRAIHDEFTISFDVVTR